MRSQRFLPHKEIALRPSRGALTDVAPQNVKEEYKRKEFRLLEILAALKEGKLPSNDELQGWVTHWQNTVSSISNRDALSSDGRTVLENFEQLLDTLRSLVEEKNRGEKLQQFLFHSYLASRGTDLAVPGGVSSDAKQGMSAIGTIARLLITSNNFRYLVSDLADTVRDIYGASRYVADQDNNRQDDSGFRQEYTRDRYQDSGRGYDFEYRDMPYEQPSLSGRYYDQPYESGYRDEGYRFVPRDPFEDVRRSSGNQPMYRDDGYTTPRRSQFRDSETGREVPYYVQEPLSPSHNRRREFDDDNNDENNDNSNDRRSSMAGRKVSQKADRARQLAHRLPDIAQNIDPEKKQRLVSRIQMQLRELRDNPEYLSSVEFVADSVQQLLEKGKTSYRSSRVDANVFQASLELKSIIEDFASGQSLNPLLDALFTLYGAMNADLYCRDYVHDVKAFLGRALREPEYLDTPLFSDRLTVLMDRGRRLLREHHRDETDAVLNELDSFMVAFESDKLTSALARDITALSESVMYNDDGQLSFKSDLFDDFRRVFLPAILSHVQYIALPKIEHRDPQYDIVLDNIILSSKNVLPNILEVRMENAGILSPYSEINDRFTHRITLNAFQIQADVHDVSFYYRKKTFPRLKDWGVADFQIMGQGISVYTTVEYDRWREDRTLIPRVVDVMVDDIHLHVHHSYHDGMYKIITPMLIAALKRQIRTGVQRTILDYLSWFDERITDIKRDYTGANKKSLHRTFTQQFVPGFLRHRNKGRSDSGNGIVSTLVNNVSRAASLGNNSQQQQQQRPLLRDRQATSGTADTLANDDDDISALPSTKMRNPNPRSSQSYLVRDDSRSTSRSRQAPAVPAI
ncbi:hypothetical protein RI367_003455 [Sorochytrium milnesiophthora]